MVNYIKIFKSVVNSQWRVQASSDQNNSEFSTRNSVDFLLVILFDRDGKVVKALKSPVSIAQQHGKKDKHQNGWVISTTNTFLKDPSNDDITIDIKKLNGDS